MFHAAVFRVLMLVCPLALGACASIPLMTAMRLSTLQEKDVLQMDPADVRVRVALPRGNELDVAQTRLSLRVESDGQPAQRADMTLRLLARTDEVRSRGLFHADLPVTVHEMALAPEGAAQLRALQKKMLAMRGGKFVFGYDTRFDTPQPDMKEMPFWVDLKLRAGDAYLPLFDAATMKFK